MAKANPQPSDSVEQEKNRLAIEKLRILEREKTRRLAILCFFGTAALGIITWAAVRMTDKPPWLVFALAILAAIGGPSIMLFRAELRLKRKVQQGKSRLDVRSTLIGNPVEADTDQASDFREGI